MQTTEDRNKQTQSDANLFPEYLDNHLINSIDIKKNLLKKNRFIIRSKTNHSLGCNIHLVPLLIVLVGVVSFNQGHFFTVKKNHLAKTSLAQTLIKINFHINKFRNQRYDNTLTLICCIRQLYAPIRPSFNTLQKLID
jgi:hypothetical protein